MGWKMVRYLYHCSICSHFNSSFGHLLYTPDRIYVAAVKGFIIICFAGSFHSQLCGIWHLHFYGNTFRGRNYFPISSPANREFYCPCIRCLVRGPLSPFFRTAAAVWVQVEASTVIWQIYCSHNIAYNTSISGTATPTHTFRPQPTICT